MASSFQLLIIVSTVAVVLPKVAFATEYLVGDTSGWTVDFDYAAWAKDKEFHVGDKLVFVDPLAKHSVFRVNATTFNDCAIPPRNESLATGNLIITLSTPGKKWYFCGVGEHCKGGQKLAITVWPAMEAPAPAPNSVTGTTTSLFYVLSSAMISLIIMVHA